HSLLSPLSEHHKSILPTTTTTTATTSNKQWHPTCTTSAIPERHTTTTSETAPSLPPRIICSTRLPTSNSTKLRPTLKVKLSTVKLILKGRGKDRTTPKSRTLVTSNSSINSATTLHRSCSRLVLRPTSNTLSIPSTIPLTPDTKREPSSSAGHCFDYSL
ncbi:hypothetical protein K457DRAFT_35205, partial [Linnemannia elongata AG-77]